MREAICPPRICAALAAVLLAALASTAASASAATPAPDLKVHVLPMPTNFSSADTEECLKSETATLVKNRATPTWSP